MYPKEILELADQIISSFASRKLKIVTAESCTGGLIAGALTEIPGASAVVERGFVSYSNNAKIEVLGVEPDLLQVAGSVSADVAEEMAQGALEFSGADVAISSTGIAGPDGGTPLKPVGLVYFGIATRQGVKLHYRCQFAGDRTSIRLQAVKEAFRLLQSIADDN